MLKFKTTDLERKRKSSCKIKDDDGPSAKFTRSSQKAGEEDVEESKTEKEGICFICYESIQIKNLRLTMTLALHEKVQRCAMTLPDEKFLLEILFSRTICIILPDRHVLQGKSLAKFPEKWRLLCAAQTTGMCPCFC